MKDELIIENNPKSSIAEAIKTIRTNLQFSSIDSKVKTFLITSTLPSEGKSFICSNLAVSFAQNGNKTIVVDCDIRKGRQHKIFNIPNEKGLSNLLIENVKTEHKKYINKTNIDNLSILTMGVVPPNPTELLDSEKMKELISILEKEYDVVIFDSVPVIGLTDALVLAKMVDEVVIVCAVKETPIELLTQTKKALLGINANIAGIVVNRIPSKHNHYYYYDKYYTND